MPPHRVRCPTFASGRRTLAGVLLSALAAAVPASAQTDFHNTDAGRPIRTEDAYAIERYALDVHLAPVTFERRAGRSSWTFTPEVAYGLVPRTQFEIGLPIVARGDAIGLAGTHVSVLSTFNTETRQWPAVGVRGSVILPTGQFAPDKAYSSLKGLMTRSYGSGRVHLNGGYTFAGTPDATALAQLDDVSRWAFGGAVDRTFALQSFLLTAEAFVEQPMDETADPAWSVAGGIRYQLTPTYGFDAGIGTQLTGDDRPLFVTFGIARSTPMKVLMPGLGRWWGR